MNQSEHMKKIASPFSTGGGGPDLERPVGAYYLAMALLRSIPRGQEAGLTREVKFQRLYEGEPLDDLIIHSELPIGEAKLALQIKRNLAFGEANEVFDEVIHASWKTFRSPKFTLGIDRFGIVLGLYSKTIDEYYQSVLTWARSSANAADFFSRISTAGLSNRMQQCFVDLVRAKLDSYAGGSVSNDELWNFLRSMVILHFDFQQAGSRDQAYIVEILGYRLPPEKKNESANLFGQLTKYAAEANRTAGSLDTSGLIQRLQADGFLLSPAPDCRRDLERLYEHGRFVLKDIRTDIGNLVLNRTAIVADIREKMFDMQLLELVGPPGVGKSAILKALVESQQGEGAAIVFAWDRIVGPGWEGFASHLQLTQRLRDILLAVSSATRPCIFIDGIDRIVEPGARKVVNDLLRSMAEIPLSQDGSHQWTLVVSAREEQLQELHTWLDWRAIGRPEAVRIPELTSEEVALIAEQSPHLAPLLSLTQLDPIIKNPFMLSLLEDRRMLPDSKELPPAATEVEISEVWWEKLVGRDGTLGRARQQALLDLGGRTITSPGRRLLVGNMTAEVLTSLESDRILLRDPDRDVYRFSHDLLEDWVLYRVLNQHREELPAFFRDIGQPFGLLRAVQLLGASLLEKQHTAHGWLRLVEQVEQALDLAPRWRQALLTAPLLSVRARDLLDKAEPFLLATETPRLNDLLVALRTVEVNPDFSLLPVAAMLRESTDDLVGLLLTSPVPRWRVWLPLMDWILKHLDRLPTAVGLETVKVLEIWQQKAPVGSVYRREIGKIGLAWLKELEKRDKRWSDDVEEAGDDPDPL